MIEPRITAIEEMKDDRKDHSRRRPRRTPDEQPQEDIHADKVEAAVHQRELQDMRVRKMPPGIERGVQRGPADAVLREDIGAQRAAVQVTDRRRHQEEVPMVKLIRQIDLTRELQRDRGYR